MRPMSIQAVVRAVVLTLLVAVLPAARAQSGPATGAPAATSGYKFAPVNQYGIQLTAAYWNPIIQYVSDKSGVKLELKIGRTSADTTSFVLAQEVDFVFTNHLFSPEREKLGWKVFGRRQTPPLHGQIIVPADSPITELSQLADADIGFPGPEALVAYKFTFAQLLNQGIQAKPVFAGNMDGALTQLFSGKVKAVGGNDQLIAGYAKRENKKYRVLWQSEPVHDLALMNSARVPAKDVQAVAAAFIGMAQDPVGKEVLRKTAAAVGLPDNAVFISSNGSEYASYRKFYQTAPPQLR